MIDLSVGATTAWRTAVVEALEDKHENLEKEHIFVGILSLGKVLDAAEGDDRFDTKILDAIRTEFISLSTAFFSIGLDMSGVQMGVREKLGKGNYEHKERTVHRSEECRRIFEKTEDSAQASRVTILHLMVSILESPGKIIETAIRESGGEPSTLRDRISSSAKQFSAEKEPKKKEWSKPKSFLERYGRDLGKEARAGKLGPFIGRDKEVLRTIQTLARSKKNNPVLVGEPGVGKTAVIEAIALGIFKGTVPHFLEGKNIVEINMGVLLGGTKFRGEFEERLSRIIEEVKEKPHTILFIDEIHSLISNEKGEGGSSGSNIMKPALARGEFRCIGATTVAEYRRYIENDAALERRFEKVLINEPTRDEAVEILEGIREELEMYHQVMISPKAVKMAVDLSIRFDGEHQLPDKAIDLLDKAAARVHIPMLISTCRMKDDELEDVKIPEILPCDVVEELSAKIGIPKAVISGHFNGEFRDRLRVMQENLKLRIRGQDEALEKICRRLFMSYAALSKRKGPLAVFLFMGPSGVGKTETAKVLAEILFGHESDLIRLDMSEFMEEHSVSKLIGSAPGYVGYQEEGQLTGSLRSKPYSIVLMDEVEKAHPRVFDIFLQLFDAGRLTDSKGRTIDARNTIFILTTNIRPPDEGTKPVGFIGGTEEGKDKKAPELKLFFRTEFINRIDEQVLFINLDADIIKEILAPMVGEMTENLEKKYGVSLKLTEGAEELLVKKGYSREMGARELRRTVEDMLEGPLSDLIINGDIKSYHLWEVKEEGERLVICGVGDGGCSEDL